MGTVYWVIRGAYRVGNRSDRQNVKAWRERFLIVRVISSKVFLVGRTPMVRNPIAIKVQVILIVDRDRERQASIEERFWRLQDSKHSVSPVWRL
jgi:hypothetical protein